MSIITYLSLGGNLGNTIEIFQETYQILEKKVGEITKFSSFYQTAAWGPIKQADFINQVIEVSTRLSATDLMQTLLEIEKEMGRIRDERWGPRTLDLDILFFGDQIIAKENLEIPHPRMEDRKFVLIPLAEINPNFIHPKSQKTVKQILLECEDECDCRVV
ncbi:2-amino-4-hydroxy-6-hydroxymethyldihydropteridine diphosphokinase [Aquirufa sp. ROCK-SH2]